MANAYVVASGDEPEHGQQLPSDMWTEVLRHTAARFAVEWDCAMAFSVPDPGGDSWFDVIRGSACVRLRYEFKLERRRATGPRMLRARFTRCVCPRFKRADRRWLALTEAQQEAIEHHFARSATIAPFLELRVQLPDDPDSFNWGSRIGRFVFVRRFSQDDPRNQPSLVELSPEWSQICRARLVHVRDQLQSLFHMDLRDQHGQLIWPRREIWD